MALEANDPAMISSQCVVFAESEMISLRARGERHKDGAARANIAAGIHFATARRVKSLLGRIGTEPDLVFTGGVANNAGMWHALETLIGAKFVRSPIDMIYAGALGAAVHAGRHHAAALAAGTARRTARAAARTTASPARKAAARAAGGGRKDRRGAQLTRGTKMAPSPASDLSLSPALRPIQALIAAEQQDFTEGADGRKRAGYFCAYTPPEVLNAAGLRHARLFKAGSPEIVSQGERYTQSVFCDFSKSCIGGFEPQGGDPFYHAVDKLYTFHTCASMKRATEVIERFVPTKLLNLPRLRNEPASREFFRDEISHYRDDVAELAGRPVTDAEVSAQIVLYNKVRALLRSFSALRKRPNPPLTGRDFLELVRGYYYLPPLTLLEVYGKLYRKLARLRDNGDRPVRLMISGSIMADGDRRLVELIEQEIGARVVVEDHCTGFKPFAHTLPEEGDPFQALANGYLDQAPCARMKPLDDSLDFSSGLAEEYGVDGVVYVYLKFCACYGVSKLEFIERLQGRGIPVLEISSDYSQSDHGQLKTRVEAFIEVLQDRRTDAILSPPAGGPTEELAHG